MGIAGSLPTILQTKLYRPPLMDDYIPRQRLHERLEQVGQRPLTIVSAPAGYGKSALLSAWFEQCKCRNAWLSLDENDNDLGVFESYFLAALRSAIPSFGDGLLDLLDSAQLPPPQLFIEMLFAELGRLQDNVFLMIDDYGAITNDVVHEFIIELMRRPPPNLHLVLGTRYDPPLPLNDWRACSHLLEIRSVELRFSLEETSCFMQQAVDSPLDEQTIVALNEKTEGWIAGLRLAALSFSRVEGFSAQIDELSGSNMYIRDYLASQVLTHLPAETQLFLLQTSILDRLSASLCEAVIMLDSPLIDTQETLLELESANIFTIPLDDLQHWFRYHHLFQQFLQMRLHEGYSSTVVVELHRRATSWFAENGYIEEALQHALAAGDMDTVLNLVAANRQELMNREQFQRLSRWLKMFPQEFIDESPDLLLLQARFAQIQRFDMVEVNRIVDKVETLISSLVLEPQKAERLLAENAALHSAKDYFTLDPQASLASSRNALDVIPQQWYSLRSYCWIYGAVSLQMMGDLSGAYKWIQQGCREDMAVSDGPQARNAAAEGFVCWVAADLVGLQRVGEFMIGVVSDGRWQSHGWAHYFLACAYYHHNDLDNAQRHAQLTFNQRFGNHALANVFSAFILALIEQVKGNPEAVQTMVSLASDYAVEIRSPTFTLMVQSFKAELAVLQGRAREVNQWAELACEHLELSAMPFFYSPALTIPKVLMATGAPGNSQKVDSCLQQLHAFAVSTHNVRILIEVLALEAMLNASNNDEEAALAILEESLALAQPGGFIRLYVDLGREIAGLLRRLQQRGSFPAYIASILKAFSAAPVCPQSDQTLQLIEPMTYRESEILELLARRYSNKEIATELVIAPATVKHHTIKIYQKLAVHNRREAVTAAVAAGLIPPEN